MSARKSFTAPFWWLLFFLIADISILSVGLTAMREMRRSEMDVDYYRSLFKAVIILHALIIGFIIAECIVYWKLRYKEYNKLLAWAQVISFLLALIILPLAPLLLGYLAELGVGESLMRLIEPLRQVLMRALLILGHVCFILVLVDRYRRRKKEEQKPEEDRKDLLSEYSE